MAAPGPPARRAPRSPSPISVARGSTRAAPAASTPGRARTPSRTSSQYVGLHAGRRGVAPKRPDDSVDLPVVERPVGDGDAEARVPSPFHRVVPAGPSPILEDVLAVAPAEDHDRRIGAGRQRSVVVEKTSHVGLGTGEVGDHLRRGEEHGAGVGSRVRTRHVEDATSRGSDGGRTKALRPDLRSSPRRTPPTRRPPGGRTPAGPRPDQGGIRAR